MTGVSVSLSNPCRCSMNIEMYEGLAIMKSTLKARQCLASTMTLDQPMRRSCLLVYQNYQKKLEKKKKKMQHERKLQNMTEAAASTKVSLQTVYLHLQPLKLSLPQPQVQAQGHPDGHLRHIGITV
ncbi:hypothetical protein AMECASPLE_036078 [Ameca splendens]|uniref:Uncharacterized protein n=1 Tax=Ameca splendens TaxID=208324 RepID=A0ABV0YJ87_9TELE